jgi:hypothetical protein
VYDLCRLAMLTNASLFDPATLVHFLTGFKKDGTLGWY